MGIDDQDLSIESKWTMLESERVIKGICPILSYFNLLYNM